MKKKKGLKEEVDVLEIKTNDTETACKIIVVGVRCPGTSALQSPQASADRREAYKGTWRRRKSRGWNESCRGECG